MLKHILALSLLVTTIQGCPHICTCIGDTISCRNRNIHTVPAFSLNDFHGVKVLDLSFNNFTVLPSNAFSNAHFEKLLLNNNHLRFMDFGTFKGLESEIKHLDISNNRLTVLPVAVANLSNLKVLNVSNNFVGNSVLDMTQSVMRALGDTITDFTFGSKMQRTWPVTVTTHLQDLHRLEVTGLHPSLTILPSTAFHSFETTLLELSIHNTNLLVVPLGISNLRNLDILHFDYNRNTGDQGMLLQSFPTSNRSKLTTLSLKGDSLTVFPRVLRYLKKLVKFSIDDNPIDFLSESSVEGLSSLLELTLRNCSLERIPAALATIPHLETIDLSSNTIETIEQRDLEGFSGIKTLVLSNMPLKYISRDSLKPLHSIKEITMNNTSLTEVPFALNFTTTLDKVNLGNDRLDCMCENMVWLLHRLVGCVAKGTREFKVFGDCDTIHSTVDDYLTNYAPYCPGYKKICNIMPYG